MTLSEALLEKLNKWRPAGRQSLDTSEGGWEVSISADRADDLGCLVWELTARSGGKVAVRDWAERVASRATGLLERLKLIEVDDGQDKAMLRSDEPCLRGDELRYYEVMLGGDGSASVRRFHAPRTGGRRVQVGFALTHEALAKLAGDLTSAK